MSVRYLFAAVALFAVGAPTFAQANRTKDVIYGRKDGVALTMDVFTPKSPNGAGVIVCISFGFESASEAINKVHPFATAPFLNEGYTVFAVVHGSQPRFTVPEIVDDIHLAVRYIKANAKDYKVKPNKLGITGGSSGGYLALMMGCDFKAANPKAQNAVERESSQVAAVACFFPVSDFRPFEENPPKGFVPDVLFPHRELDSKSNRLVTVTADRRREIGTACSPIVCAKKEKCPAPTLIIHGDMDNLIPISQSQRMIAQLDKCDVKCHLEKVEGMDHDFRKALPHVPKLVKWFDEHLLDKK